MLLVLLHWVGGAAAVRGAAPWSQLAGQLAATGQRPAARFLGAAAASPSPHLHIARLKAPARAPAGTPRAPSPPGGERQPSSMAGIPGSPLLCDVNILQAPWFEALPPLGDEETAVLFGEGGRLGTPEGWLPTQPRRPGQQPSRGAALGGACFDSVERRCAGTGPATGRRHAPAGQSA